MIERSLNLLKKGLLVMQNNTKLLLVGILVFVFPLIFISITQSFFKTAYDNIETAENQRIGLLHDTLALLLIANSIDEPTLVTEALDSLMKLNPDIAEINISLIRNGKTDVLYSTKPYLVGSPDGNASLYQSFPMSTSTPHIFKTLKNGTRTWQVFRRVEIANDNYYISSEHNFGNIDSVMLKRKQDSYFGLTAIFLFIIALAYWLNNQSDWERRYSKLSRNLDEQTLFSSMIAHEFRTPLTAIKGYSSFLLDSRDISQTERNYVASINSSAERLVALVNDFLEVSKLQAGKIILERQEVELNQLITSVTDSLAPLAKEKNLELTCRLQNSKLFITTDKDRLTQVLINLVSNALKYTEKGGVEIQCVAVKKKAIIRVQDTGMGISADDQKKLFQPFERVGSVDKSTTKGTGLGMYISKELIIQLGGTIGVESIKGVGSHIEIVLPIR